MSWLGVVVRRSTGKRTDPGWTLLRFGSSFSSKGVVHGHCLVTVPRTVNQTLKWLDHVAGHLILNAEIIPVMSIRYKLPRLSPLTSWDFGSGLYHQSDTGLQLISLN